MKCATVPGHSPQDRNRATPVELDWRIGEVLLMEGNPPPVDMLPIQYTPSLNVQAARFGRSRHLLSHVKSDQTQIVQATDSVLLLVAKASGRIIHRITTISRAGQSTMNRSIIQVSLQQIESISHLKNRTMVDSNKVPIGKRIFFLVSRRVFASNTKEESKTWWSNLIFMHTQNWHLDLILWKFFSEWL